MSIFHPAEWKERMCIFSSHFDISLVMSVKVHVCSYWFCVLTLGTIYFILFIHFCQIEFTELTSVGKTWHKHLILTDNFVLWILWNQKEAAENTGGLFKYYCLVYVVMSSLKLFLFLFEDLIFKS